MQNGSPATIGPDHVGLTLRDLEQSRHFFCDSGGWQVVDENRAYPAVFVSDGKVMLTLWRAEDPATARAFDRRANIGLHHLALAFSTDDALDRAWERVSAYPGIVVDVPPSPTRPGSPTRHFLVFIPGGIRLELVAPKP